MKNLKITSTRAITLTIAATFTMLILAACAKKISFQTSSVVPAAKGSVKVKKDNNSNYQLKVYIGNLAKPDRLQPAKKMYVVWMQTESNGIKNIGQIKTSTGLLNSKLKASFESVTSFKPVKIFVTAEDEAAVQYPGSQVVLSTSDF
jgi:hypothetical protein